MKKAPSMKMRKYGMTEFMKKHNVTKSEGIPTKPQPYQRSKYSKEISHSLIKEANVLKKYLIDNITKTSGCSVL